MKNKLMTILFVILALFLTGCVINTSPIVPGGPGTDEPGIDEPGTDEPGTDEPGTDEPGTDEPSQNTVVSTKFTSLSQEYEIQDSEVDLHYFKDNSLPYIDVTDFINLLDGAYLSSEFEILKDYTNSRLTLNIYYYYSETQADLYSAVLNFEKDTIYTAYLDFYYIFLNEPETEYDSGLIDLEPKGIPGRAVTFDLGKHGFDMVIKDEEFLVPLTMMNLIFNQQMYFDVYFNGETLIGIDTADITGDSDALADIRTSGYNNEEMPESIKKATKNYMEFAIEYFYGLKEDQGITSGIDYLNKFSTNFNNDTSKAVFDVIYDLDEMHSSHITRGFYNNPGLLESYDIRKYGPNVQGYIDNSDLVAFAAQEYFGVSGGYIDIPEYEIIDNGKTAIIYIFEFEVDTPEYIEMIINELPNTVENIIMDLTFNGGGNLGAVLRIFALMTDDPIYYHIQSPLEQYKISYGVQGMEPAYSEYNYLVRTSSITFSAANLMASMAKEMNIPVIGQKSSGGASAINFFVLPEGSIVVMSSNMVLSTLINDEYLSIEKGITPNIILQSLYDENEIIAAINASKR